MTYVNLLLRNVEFFSCILKQASEEYWKGFPQRIKILSTSNSTGRYHRRVLSLIVKCNKMRMLLI